MDQVLPFSAKPPRPLQLPRSVRPEYSLYKHVIQKKHGIYQCDWNIQTASIILFLVWDWGFLLLDGYLFFCLCYYMVLFFTFSAPACPPSWHYYFSPLCMTPKVLQRHNNISKKNLQFNDEFIQFTLSSLYFIIHSCLKEF